MSVQLCELLAKVSCGEAVRHERLELIPLRLGVKSDLEYLLFDEAVAATDVRLEEVSAAGSVPTLRVHNRTKHRVLLPDGTMLVGCKQNRVVNVSIMLAPESETLIPVSCVERGRWHFTTGGFSPAEYGDSALRRKMCVGTSDSLKRSGAVQMDQGSVWGHVESVLGGFGAASPTRAYHAVYEEQHEQLAEYESRLQYPADASGVAVAVDGNIEEIELFDKPATLQKLWPRLVRSYALSAMWNKRSRGRNRDARSFVEQALCAGGEKFASVGIGTTVRLSSDGAVGAALECDEQLVHLALFAQDGHAPSAGTTSMPEVQDQNRQVADEAKHPRSWWKFWA